MTKTLTVLSILVPITVPTYCAMLDLQTAPHLNVFQVSKSGTKPPPTFVRDRSKTAKDFKQLSLVDLILCLERAIHFDSYCSKNQKSGNLWASCAIMC